MVTKHFPRLTGQKRQATKTVDANAFAQSFPDPPNTAALGHLPRGVLHKPPPAACPAPPPSPSPNPTIPARHTHGHTTHSPHGSHPSYFAPGQRMHQQPALSQNSQDGSILPSPLNQAIQTHPITVRSPSPAHTSQLTRPPHRVLSLREQYEPAFLHFMSWRDGVKYSKGTTFPPETRLSITAMELYRWAKFRVYGDPEADENVVPPKNYRVLHRYNSLLH